MDSPARIRAVSFHPLTAAFYLMTLVLASMVALYPPLSAISLAGALITLGLLDGTRNALRFIARWLPALIMVALVNPLINTAGGTVLFSYGASWGWHDGAGRPFTLEALIYGGALALMLAAIITWCKVGALYFDAEHTDALLGRLSSTLSATFTTTIRFVPLLGRRLRETALVRQALTPAESPLHRSLATLSGVLSASLERGVVTADSMSARGAQSQHAPRDPRTVSAPRDARAPRERVLYTRFVLRRRDYVAWGIILGCAAAFVIGALSLSVVYFPRLSLTGVMHPAALVTLSALVILGCAPLVYGKVRS